MLEKNLNNFLNDFGIKNYKVYNSNIGYIIVLENFVYKIFILKDFYTRELKFYKIFSSEGIDIPKFEDLGYHEKYNFFILKLENIRKDYERSEKLEEIGYENIFEILKKVYLIETKKYFDYDGPKKIILGDIHASNFFLKNKNLQKEIGIFDFSSCIIGEIEKDIGCFYIEIGLNDDIIENLINYLGFGVNYKKIYAYSITKLLEMLKHGLNMNEERKIKYLNYISILKNKLGIN